MLSKRLYSFAHQIARYQWLWLLIWVLGLLLLQSPQQSFMAHDEGYYAQQARWILANNDWVTVGWWGDPVFDRTIGLQWLIALCYHWFGFSELSVRLPSMVTSLGAVFLTWRIGQRLMPSTTGLWGAAILAILPLWMQASKLGMQDMPLICLELLAIWALLKAEEHPQQRVLWGLVTGAALGLGVMFKSVMVVIPMLALLPYLVRSHRHHRHLLNRGIYIGLGLGLIPFLTWLGVAYTRYGWYPIQQLFAKVILLAQANASSATGEVFRSNSTWAYYAWQIPLTTFPWFMFAILGTVILWKTPSYGRRTLWLGYPAVVFIVLSGFDTRTWYYALQIYPFLALLAALGLTLMARLFVARSPGLYRVAVGASWAIGVLAILLMSAGVALLLTPGDLIPPDIRAYGWVGTLGGLGWLLPWGLALYRRDPVKPATATLWKLGWLLGPWLGIAAVFLTGLWGDYASGLKTTLQTPPIAPVLATNSIHFVQPDANRESVLLTVYTPNLGSRLNDWSELPAGEYAWGNPRLTPLIGDNFTIIATVEGGWQLVQVPWGRVAR